MTIAFWTNDPTTLFNHEHIAELWPMPTMCYEQKMNAISRLILLLTLVGYAMTQSMRIIAVGILTLLVIYVLFTMRKQKIANPTLEGFQPDDRPMTYVNPATLDTVLRSEFKEGTKKNPFSNVLLTQINDDPERKAAPPSFNVDVDEDITKNVKRAIQMINPDIKNTNKQLFGDLWQRFQLDQSLRPFHSTPNTRVTNDQGAFGEFLYGNMPSAKEDTPEGNMQRYADSYRYTLY